MKRVRGFRLTEETEERLELLCEHYGSSYSAMVESLISTRYAADRGKLETAAEKKRSAGTWRALLRMLAGHPDKDE